MQITFENYSELRSKLWNVEDRRAFFIVAIAVETGATPSEIVHIDKHTLIEHKTKENIPFYSTEITEGAKAVIVGRVKKTTSKTSKKSKKKTPKFVTKARTRTIVFNSDLSRKIKDWLGFIRDNPSRFLIPKVKFSGSLKSSIEDKALTRAGLSYILKNCGVPIPFNLHHHTETKTGGRHLFKNFMEYKLIIAGKYSESQMKKLMGHKPKEVHDTYGQEVNIDLAFTMVETTFTF